MCPRCPSAEAGAEPNLQGELRGARDPGPVTHSAHVHLLEQHPQGCGLPEEPSRDKHLGWGCTLS